jgi:hypothetical protein
MRIEAIPELDVEQRRRDRVIIAAAIAAIFGPRAAIRSIRTTPGHRDGAWVREGRLGIQSCHETAASLIGLPAGRGRGAA